VACGTEQESGHHQYSLCKDIELKEPIRDRNAVPQWPEAGKNIRLTSKVEDFTEIKSDSPFDLDNISIEDAI
jgi:hypothetical protein